MTILYNLFINELNNHNITIEEFFNNCFEWLSLAWQLASLSFERDNFLNIDISQGSVATQLRCGRTFNNAFIANLIVGLSV